MFVFLNTIAKSKGIVLLPIESALRKIESYGGEEEEKGEGIAGDGNSRLSPYKFMTFDLAKKLLYGVQREPGNQG